MGTAQVVERVEGHYDIRDAPCGKVYRWCPESTVVECSCGETLTCTASAHACQCGAAYADLVHGPDRRRSGEEASHPWRREYHAKDARHEHDYWLDLRAL